MLFQEQLKIFGVYVHTRKAMDFKEVLFIGLFQILYPCNYFGCFGQLYDISLLPKGFSCRLLKILPFIK